MSVYEDSRKVQAIGSSLAVTLPAFFVELCELEKGSEVRVIYGLDGVLVVVKDDDLVNVREGLVEIIERLRDLELRTQRYDKAQKHEEKPRRGRHRRA